MLQGVENIIFDLGGVLVDLNRHRCIGAFEAIGAAKVAEYVRTHRTKDLFLDIELGRASVEEFCDEVRNMSGIKVDNALIVAAWNQLLGTISAVRKQRLLALRQTHRVFLLSNTNSMHWRFCEQLFCEDSHNVTDYFERVFLSYEMHMAKPSQQIFEEVVREAAIDPAKTLFVDDSAENCKAAQQVGILPFVNTSFDRWLEELG